MIEAAATRTPPTFPAWWQSRSAPYAALVLLIVLTYIPVWHAGFIWDDDTHLTANPCIIGPLGLKEIWTSSAANYFPLVLTTFWFEHALWGLAPLPYHVVNVVFHVGTALLLISVFRRLRVRAPWFGAALWALHPVQAESVAWVSELTNAQSGFFFVLTVALYVSERPMSRLRLFAIAACAAAALLSKPSTVALPVVLLLCRSWKDGTWSWRHGIRMVPLFALSAAIASWTIWEQRYHSLALGPEWQFSATTRVAIAGRDVWFYLGKLLSPFPLAFVYPRWTVPQPTPAVLLTVLAAIGWTVLWLRRNGPPRPVFFAATYFILLLFPVLGFFDVFYFRYSFVADHFQYLASIGPLALFSATGATLIAKIQKAHVRQGLLGACFVVLFVIAGASFSHARIFTSSNTLWRETLAVNPNSWIAETIVGNSDARAGKNSDAILHHRHAIALDPLASEPHYNLGVAFAGLDRYEDAIREYERALVLKPRDPDTEHNLGVALVAVNRPAEAVEHYQRALQLRPNFAPTELLLGLALTISSRAAEALPHYATAVRLQPADFRAQYSFGRTLEILGRWEDAIPHFRAAIKVSPNDAGAHGHLGLVLAQLRDNENAMAELERAAELEPRNPTWHDAAAKLTR